MIDLKKMSDDEIKALYREMEKLEPRFESDMLDHIESVWEGSELGRKAALTVLAEPWKYTEARFFDDKEVATAYAELLTKLDPKIYYEMGDLLTEAQQRIVTAICSRDDAEEIVDGVLEETKTKPNTN